MIKELELELDEIQEDVLDEEEDDNIIFVQTHEKVNQDLSGELMKLEDGYVEVRLSTTNDMLADSHGLIHGGFIFSAADYAAMLAVNEPNVVLVGSDCQFLSPVKLFDDVLIKAKVRHQEGRKRNVHVEGFVHEIKVFEGEFKTVITDRHILKLKLVDEEEEELPTSTE